jgi:hypothetical protein
MKFMDADNVSDMWKDLNDRLDALSVDNFDFLLSDVFEYVIYLKGGFDWRSSACSKVFDELEFPHSDVLRQYKLQRNTVMYLSEISHLIDYFGRLNNLNVLEVGGGFGNFCRVYHELLKPSSYTVLDTPSMSRFAKKFLSHHGYNDIDFQDDVDGVMDKEFDLFVSNICLSETPVEYRQRIFEDVIPNCKRCFIIDGDGKNDSFNQWLGKSIGDNFSHVKEYPFNTPWKVKIYLGENK